MSVIKVFIVLSLILLGALEVKGKNVVRVRRVKRLQQRVERHHTTVHTTVECGKLGEDECRSSFSECRWNYIVKVQACMPVPVPFPLSRVDKVYMPVFGNLQGSGLHQNVLVPWNSPEVQEWCQKQSKNHKLAIFASDKVERAAEMEKVAEGYQSGELKFQLSTAELDGLEVDTQYKEPTKAVPTLAIPFAALDAITRFYGLYANSGYLQMNLHLADAVDPMIGVMSDDNQDLTMFKASWTSVELFMGTFFHEMGHRLYTHVEERTMGKRTIAAIVRAAFIKMQEKTEAIRKNLRADFKVDKYSDIVYTPGQDIALNKLIKYTFPMGNEKGQPGAIRASYLMADETDMLFKAELFAEFHMWYVLRGDNLRGWMLQWQADDAEVGSLYRDLYDVCRHIYRNVEFSEAI